MSADYRLIDVQFPSLTDRIVDFIAEASSGTMDATVKLQALMLIVETQHLAEKIGSGRWARLADYFENGPLEGCLERVRAIDLLKEEMERRLFPVLSGVVRDEGDKRFLHDGDNKSTEQEDDEQVLIEFPHISASLLWNNKKKLTLEHTFYPACESIEKKAELARHRIRNVDVHALYETNISDIKDFVALIGKMTEELTNQNIYAGLLMALEKLRVVFMEQAQDIYCVRTSEPSFDLSLEDNPLFTPDYCYRQCPLKNYYEDREDWRGEVAYDLEHRTLDVWRQQQGITRRPLSHAEHVQFLSERRASVIQQMQEGYPELWNLRERSGGYDTEVNEENFARMFYARRGIDRTFFHLQWELEYLDELLQAPLSAPVELSPQEQAIDAFVAKLMRLVTTCHERWHGQRCKPGAHQPEVTVEIRRDEFIRYLNLQLTDKEKPLWEYCNPATSQSKQLFCNYVVRLIKEGYFGQLPKKELARILAPIVGLSEGTVSNYLSQD